MTLRPARHTPASDLRQVRSERRWPLLAEDGAGRCVFERPDRSNDRSLPLPRGWNRVIGTLALERRALHGCFQLFNGHGESLVDNKLRRTQVGLGVTIAGWR